ncbi:MAG: TIGR02186 family protein [Terriglobia bacterium]|nr:TIGR02186 family protein [Terriglobia bacterium]
MVPVIVLLFAALCFGGQAFSQTEKVPAPADAAMAMPATTLRLSPEKIEMGTFYNGAPVRIEGTVPRGSQIIVIVRGPAKDELFNKKGRVGPIWVTVDKVHVTGTPSLFLRFSSADMHTFLDRATIDDYELDELSVKKRMHIRTGKGDPDPLYRDLIEKSYLDLKKSDGTYRRVANRVDIANEGPAGHYTLSFHWPRTASPGAYEVEVYACRDRAVVGRAATTLNLVEVGFPEFMVTLAHKHPWWYGLLAVLSAMCAGFGIDAVVSRLRRPTRPRPPELPPPVGVPAEKEVEAPGERVVHH